VAATKIIQRVCSTMIDRPKLIELLAASSDPDNPDLDTIVDLLGRTSRVAVVGISRDPLKPARRVPSYLAAKGMEIVPVNPHATRILGKDAYRELRDVPAPVDLVLLFRPSDQAGPFLREAAMRPDAPAVWLQEGIRSDPEAQEAREKGRTVVQDLCIFSVHRMLGSGRTAEPRPGGMLSASAAPPPSP